MLFAVVDGGYVDQEKPKFDVTFTDPNREIPREPVKPETISRPSISGAL